MYSNDGQEGAMTLTTHKQAIILNSALLLNHQFPMIQILPLGESAVPIMHCTYGHAIHVYDAMLISSQLS